MVWRDQPYYHSAADKHASNLQGIPEIRCFFLKSAIRSLSRLESVVAECGIRKGKSALYMLEACETSRKFYLFDFFRECQTVVLSSVMTMAAVVTLVRGMQ